MYSQETVSKTLMTELFELARFVLLRGIGPLGTATYPARTCKDLLINQPYLKDGRQILQKRLPGGLHAPTFYDPSRFGHTPNLSI